LAEFLQSQGKTARDWASKRVTVAADSIYYEPALHGGGTVQKKTGGK
jgi:hypothetical protein